MAKYNCLVVGLADSYVENLKSALPKEIAITGVAKSYSEAFSLADKLMLNAVIIAPFSPIAESYELVDVCASLPLSPVVIVLCDGTLSLDARFKKLGASVTLEKAVETVSLVSTLCELLKNDTRNAFKVDISSEKMMDEKLAHIFISSGIPPHIKGYQFLREAVKQSVRAPEMINNITKELYPTVAEKFNTSPSKVERAIRHAIEVAWSRGKIDNLNTLYGIKVFAKGEKPTNGELIALVSDKLLIECS